MANKHKKKQTSLNSREKRRSIAVNTKDIQKRVIAVKNKQGIQKRIVIDVEKTKIAENKIEEVEDRHLLKEGNARTMKITDKKLEDVANLEKRIDSEIEAIDKLIRVKRKENSMFGTFKKFIARRDNVVTKFLMLVILTFPLVIYSVIGMEQINEKQLTVEQQIDYIGTVINLGIKDKTSLTYDIDNLTIKLENKNIEIPGEQIDTWENTEIGLIQDKFTVDGTEYNISKNLSLSTLDCYNDFMYITYSNEEKTAMREIIVSKQQPSGVSIDGMKSVDGKVFELNSQLYVKSFTDSYDNSFLFYADSVAGGELATKTLANRLTSLEKSLKYSNTVEQEEVTINIKDLGTLKLSQLSAIKSAPGMYMSSADGVLRLYNYNEDIAYVFITTINNPTFMCNAADLIATNIDNLFICEGFDNEESTGYRTFALTTDNDLYVFRVASEASDSLVTELLAQFGIDRTTIEVKVVQSVVDTSSIKITEESTEEINETEEVE